MVSLGLLYTTDRKPQVGMVIAVVYNIALNKMSPKTQIVSRKVKNKVCQKTVYRFIAIVDITVIHFRHS